MGGMGIGAQRRAAGLAGQLAIFAAALACNGSDAGTNASTSAASTTDPGPTEPSTTESTTASTTTGSTTTTDADSSTSSSSTTLVDSGSSSSSSTGPAPFCGDGELDPGEACDDGNDLDTDQCAACKLAVCGDGLIQAGVEECDDGNPVDDDLCSNACISKFCTPSGARAALDTLAQDSASGCWDGNPCGHDAYNFLPAHAQNFQGFGEAISCTGAPTCVAHVGLATYEDAYICQGRWDVRCDEVLLGTIDTLGKPCVGSAMGNGCSLAFEPRKCAQIELRAAPDDDATSKCCEGSGPDSMIVAVSAW